MKLRRCYIIIFALLMAGGCVNPPDYPDEPGIAFVSLSRNFINQGDSVRVVFSFTDGDGDLGFETPDPSACDICDTVNGCFQHPTFSIFLIDERLRAGGCMVPYLVPYIPPKGSSDAISGKVDMLIASNCCIPPSLLPCIPSAEYPLDTIIYSIRLKDRAGNLSNKITLPPIYVQCN